MVVDSLAPETETRTKPKPDDSLPPSAEPEAPTVATSAITLEPPPPPVTATPPPPAIEPAVPEPRHEEAGPGGALTAPQTRQERARGLGVFPLVPLTLRSPPGAPRS